MKALEKLSHCQKSHEIQNFQIMNHIEELSTKTTITDIEEKPDKNQNRFYKVSIVWELGKTRVFYAFANDFNLKTETLQLLANSPEKLINQRATITYQELEHKDKNGTFARIKEITI